MWPCVCLSMSTTVPTSALGFGCSRPLKGVPGRRKRKSTGLETYEIRSDKVKDFHEIKRETPLPFVVLRKKESGVKGGSSGVRSLLHLVS